MTSSLNAWFLGALGYLSPADSHGFLQPPRRGKVTIRMTPDHLAAIVEWVM